MSLGVLVLAFVLPFALSFAVASTVAAKRAAPERRPDYEHIAQMEHELEVNPVEAWTRMGELRALGELNSDPPKERAPKGRWRPKDSVGITQVRPDGSSVWVTENVELLSGAATINEVRERAIPKPKRPNPSVPVAN